MLPQNNRLKNKKDIDRVFKSGKRFKQGFLLLRTFDNGLGVNRFGFVVSQKISKKAVVRNKVKRRLRALAELKMKEMKKGIDLLFVVLPGLAEKDFSDASESVNDLLIKAGCFKKAV